LRAQQYLDAYPEIADEDVSPAFVFVGPQRSGTSKLFRLLAADPRRTKLLTWQGVNPIPVACPLSPDAEDPRIAEAEAWVDELHWVQQAHELDARAPEMEAVIMLQGFMMNTTQRIVPSHQRWCAAADHTPVCDWMHSMLQFVQWQNPGPHRPWILKSPTHLPSLRALHARYPDAVLVMTHRHPLTSVASMFKLVELGTVANTRSLDRARIRDFWLRILRSNLQNFLDLRDHCTTATWVDVPYPELCDDAMRSVERIYDAVGAPLDDDAVARLQRWEEENPQHKRGEFSYRLEEFGMTRDDVEREFADYVDRFGHLF
jgi:hypothetical protein